MTEHPAAPTTEAGRETHTLLHRLSSQMKTCEMVPCPFAGLARRTEVEARAAARKEVLDEIRRNMPVAVLATDGGPTVAYAMEVTDILDSLSTDTREEPTDD